MVADFMSFVCSDYGLKPHSYSTCHAGLAAVRELRPTLILLDIVLPDGDGLALAQIVRAEMPSVKILVVSTHCDAMTLQRARDCGLHGFFNKRNQSQQLLTEAVAIVLAGRLYYPEARA